MPIKIYDTDSLDDRISKRMFGVSAKTMKIVAWSWVALLCAGLLLVLVIGDFNAH